MSVLISDGYRIVKPEHRQAVARVLARAWKDPRLPEEQFQLSVSPELERFRRGQPVEPYDSAIAALQQIPSRKGWSLLDVGAGSGYYSEVFRLAGMDVDYQGVDFAQSFVDFGRATFPGIRLSVFDARLLPYAANSFDIVFSSGCLMHIFDYGEALKEMVRVTRRFIVLNRTPVIIEEPTACFVKRAYGVPCLEMHFNEAELHRRIEECGLRMKALHFARFGHRTYVLEKP